MCAYKPKLSQCMIVKNEEENIERALSWGRKLMWEQIVVDTGSTDRTVELAQAMGAKVLHFDWIDDFSAAKNYAIGQASGDWIFFLDADEYMEPESVKKLPNILKNVHRLGYDIISTPWLQLGNTWEVEVAATQCRIFKNMPKIRYEMPIHEYLSYGGGDIAEHMIYVEELPICHTGYFPEVMEKKRKSERNIRLLLKELEKNPQNPDLMGYLGDAYKSLHKKDGNTEAEEWYRKALPLIIKSGRKYQRDVYTVLMLMVEIYQRGKEKEGELMELYQTATACFPEVYDFDYLAGRFHTDARNYEKGVFYLERAFAGMEKYGTDTYNPLMPADIPETLKALAVCYYHIHDLKNCVNTSVTLLKTDKTQIKAVELLIRCFKNESSEAVVEFFQKLYDLNDITDRVLLLRGAIRSEEKGNGVMKLLRQYCSQEELEMLDQSR